MTIDLAKADEKNASLTMKLVAKSGYRSEVKVPGVSPNQWGAIMAICDGKDACARMLASADLLDALENLLIGIGMGWDLDAMIGIANTALARATTASKEGE